MKEEVKVKLMESKKTVKIVYEDGDTKVVKGLILSQDEYTITVQVLGTNAVITLGKRAIVKISEWSDNHE